MIQIHKYAHHLGTYAVLLWAFSLPLSTSVTTISTLIALLMWCLSSDWALKKELLLAHPISRIIWLIMIYALISLSYTTAPTAEYISCLKDFFRLASIPCLMYFFYPIEKARLGIKLFIAAMGITFVLALLKVYGGVSIGHQFNYVDGIYQVSAAVFKSHIKTNFFMAMAAFFLAHQAIRSSRFRWFFLGLSSCFCFYVFYMSWGRTGYVLLGLLTAIMIWQLLKRWHRMVAFIILMFSLVAVFVSSDMVQQRVQQIYQDLEIYEAEGSLDMSSIGARLTFYKNSLVLIKAAPWFGSGLGSFEFRYKEQFPKSYQTDNPHNQFLLMAVEFGLLGLSLLLILFASMLYYSRKLVPDLGYIAQGFVLAFMFGCLANSWLIDFTEGSFFALMTALCFASVRRQHAP